jgi:hypothetical protein
MYVKVLKASVHALFGNDPRRGIEFCIYNFSYFHFKLGKRRSYVFFTVACFDQMNTLSAKMVHLIN